MYASGINTVATPNKTNSLPRQYLKLTTERDFGRSLFRTKPRSTQRGRAVLNESCMLDGFMARRDTPECPGDGGPKPLVRPFGRLLDGPRPETLSRCTTRQNLTNASLPQIRRDLARAWRLMLALRTNDAQEAIDRIELQLDDVSILSARRLRPATQLLRAVGLAFQDDCLAALEIANSQLSASPAAQNGHVASTLRRLGFWKLGKFDSLQALPRHQPRMRWSRSHALSAMFDLSIEAAVAFDHLNLTTAKRLASDALIMAQTAKAPDGLAALPACLAAHVAYEEGCLDDADGVLRDRLPAINADGSIECAVRAYLVLARIARQRMHYDFAAILLHEAEALGERRQWPRLVAAAVAERVSLLVEAGQTKEARLCAQHLERCTDKHRPGSGRCCAEIAQYLTLARWRASWAEAPSWEAVAALRQLYNRVVEQGHLYAGCRLALELAGMLASIGEAEEADALFSHTIKLGAAAGLYQIFLEKGEGSGALLRRAYDRAGAVGSEDRQLLPLLGSLLTRWGASRGEGAAKRPTGLIRDTLTAREHVILIKIANGFSNKRIARVLAISPETVKSHVKRIFLKLAVCTRIEAVARGRSLGLL